VIPAAVTLWGENVRDCSRKLIEESYGMWGNNWLTTDFRAFLFNLTQGRLYLNNVLHRIRPAENKQTCTFCIIQGKRELEVRGINRDQPEYEYYLNLLPVETVKHLFWECEAVQGIIQKVNRWICGRAQDEGDLLSYTSFMMGDMKDRKGDVKCDLIWKHFVKYYLYRCRLRVSLPSYGSLIYELLGLGRNTRRLDWEGYRIRLLGEL